MSSNRLSQDEIRSLLQGSQEAVHGTCPDGDIGANRTVRMHGDGDRAALDCGRNAGPESAAGWKGLEPLRDRVHIALSEHLRAPVQVVLTSAERILRREFIAMCGPSSFLAASVRSGDGAEISVEIELPFLLSAINRMLGGSLQDTPIPPHPLTRIETGLASRLADRIVGALLATFDREQPSQWSTVAATEVRQVGQVGFEEASVAAIQLTLGLGPATGCVRIALPWEVFQQAGNAPVEDAGLGADEVQISVVLSETSVPSSEVANLQVGDLLPSPLRLDELFEVHVDGRARFRARLGALDGQKAIRIEEFADASTHAARE